MARNNAETYKLDMFLGRCTGCHKQIKLATLRLCETCRDNRRRRQKKQNPRNINEPRGNKFNLL